MMKCTIEIELTDHKYFTTFIGFLNIAKHTLCEWAGQDEDRYLAKEHRLETSTRNGTITMVIQGVDDVE